MGKVLLISNKKPDEAGGRAEKIDTRKRLLEKEGWEVVIGYVPKPYILSFIPSVYRCWRLARKEGVDVINSISNPLHLQIIGLLVAFATGLPLIAEFRDPMVNNPDRKEGTLITRLSKIVEGFTVRSADLVVWIDGIQMQEGYFTETYPNIPEERFHKLPFLGFEKEEFERAESAKYDEFTITYAGSFYEGWIEPYRFLDGLERYVEKYGQDLRVQFYGDWNDEYQEAVEGRGLNDMVETHDFVSHERIVSVLKGSDGVLFIAGDDPDNRLNVPSKTWDYIASRSPIIAIAGPRFRVNDIIKENGLGIVAAPEDTEGISEAIRDVRTNKFDYNPDQEVFDRFSRENFVSDFAELLDSVSARS